MTFERKATGLVREAGWWDVLVYNFDKRFAEVPG
jgi:hypothetical protein